MKKTVMVYYSLEGNTAYVADWFAKHGDITLERLVPGKEPPKKGFLKILEGGRSALFDKNPRIAPLKTDIRLFDNIIIGFPVWAGTFPPAINAFLNQNNLSGKKVFVIACSSSGNADKAITNVSGRLEGNKIVASLGLVDPLKNTQATETQLGKFLENLENYLG